MNNWLLMGLLTMLLNGVVLTMQKLVPVRFTNSYLLMFYVVGGLICWIAAAVLGKRVRLLDVAFGVAAGLMSYVGNVFMIRGLSMGRAALVFPIVYGISMVLVTLISVVCFRERLTPRGICAVIVGIASIVVLKLS